MSLPAHTDVLVCGAGPTGLSLAAGLAARAVPFLLVDRLAAGLNTSRAAVIHARTLERLESLDLSRRLVAAGNKAPHFAVRDRDRRLAGIDLSGLPTAYPYGLMLPQDRTEAILEERLAELGGTVHRGCAVTDLAIGAEGARATIRDAEGVAQAVRARFVVGADGFHGTVRAAAGIPFAHGTYAQSFLLGDVEGHWPLPPDEIQLFLGRTGLMVAAPFGPGHLRLVATLDAAPEHPTLDDLRRLVAERGPGGARLDRLLWSSRFRVHHGVAARFREGPVLLAGDAAHVHSPAGGQGMNTGIQDALRLAELLSETLREGRADVLDRYEAERKPVAEGVVAMTDRMTRLATLKGPLGAGLRNLVLRGVGLLPPVRAAIARRLAELDV